VRSTRAGLRVGSKLNSTVALADKRINVNSLDSLLLTAPQERSGLQLQSRPITTMRCYDITPHASPLIENILIVDYVY